MLTLLLCLWLSAGVGGLAVIITGAFDARVVMAETLITPTLMLESDINELDFGIVQAGGESFLTKYPLTVQSNVGYRLLIKGTDLLSPADSSISTENLQVSLSHGATILYTGAVRSAFQEIHRQTVSNAVYASEITHFDLEFILNIPPQMPLGNYQGTIYLEIVALPL